MRAGIIPSKTPLSDMREHKFRYQPAGLPSGFLLRTLSSVIALTRKPPRAPARGRLPHVRMGRRWRCDPDLYDALAAGGARDGPAPVDEAPVAPEMARQPVEVEVAQIRPPGFLARRTGHERAMPWSISLPSVSITAG